MNQTKQSPNFPTSDHSHTLMHTRKRAANLPEKGSAKFKGKRGWEGFLWEMSLRGKDKRDQEQKIKRRKEQREKGLG